MLAVIGSKTKTPSTRLLEIHVCLNACLSCVRVNIDRDFLEDCSDDCFILFSFALRMTCLDSTVIECGL